MTTKSPLPAPPTDPADARAAAARFAAHAPADVRYAVLETPVGRLVAARTDRGLVRLAYDDLNGGVDAILERLAARVSPRILEQPAALDPVARELDEYFAGRRTTFDLPLDWALAGPFARRVLGAAIRIPYGQVATYAEMAGRAGSPGGSRAAGNALGSNPIPIIVPCHRVVRTGGGLGGYTGGLDRKKRLLAIERGELTLAV
jgi:methylated-DNA-[protein]-cysteine S-methyltransferase